MKDEGETQEGQCCRIPMFSMMEKGSVVDGKVMEIGNWRTKMPAREYFGLRQKSF